jgi:hypothetical protein
MQASVSSSLERGLDGRIVLNIQDKSGDDVLIVGSVY